MVIFYLDQQKLSGSRQGHPWEECIAMVRKITILSRIAASAQEYEPQLVQSSL